VNWQIRHSGVVANSVWLLADKAMRLLLVFGVTVLISRYLGPEKLGVLSVAAATAFIVMEFTLLGLRSGTVVHDLVREPKAHGEIVGTSFGLTLIASVFGMLLTSWVIHWLRPADEQAQIFAMVIAAGLAVRGFDVADLWFQATEQAWRGVLARFLALLAISLLRLLGIMLAWPLAAFAVFIGLEYVLLGITFLWLYHYAGGRVSRWQFSGARARTLLQQAWPMLLSGLGLMLYTRIDQLMLGELVDDHAVGLYAVASQFAEAWWFVPNAIGTALFPTLIQLHAAQPAVFQQRFQYLLDGLFVLGIALAIIVTFVAEPLIGWLYGAAYAESASILSLYIWAMSFIFLRTAIARWCLLENARKFFMLSQLLGAGLNISLNLWLIPHYGATGAAWATIIAYFCSVYLALWLYRPMWPLARSVSRALVAPIRWPFKWVLKR